MADPARLARAISPDSPADPALDVRRLVADGLARAQQLGGRDWTDYNTHDPGVTILQVLAFALTDLAYRTGHPIADLVASSSASTGTPLSEQPLFVGPDILSTAPVTLDDLRKLVCDRVSGLRNAWIRPVTAAEGQPAPPPGLLRVDLLPVWQVPASARHDRLALTAEAQATRARDAGRLVAETRRLLDAHRPLGTDFAVIREAETTGYRVSARVTVTGEADADELVARILHAIDDAVNPPPTRRDASALIEAGAAPDAVYDGPKPVHGVIDSVSLAPLDRRPRRETVLDALLSVPGVVAAADLEVSFEGEFGADRVPLLDRSPKAIAGLVLLRDALPVPADTDRVLKRLAQIEESSRWSVLYEAPSARPAEYGRVPPGRADRALARYRSIQHLFPEIYGIGRFGTGDRIASGPGGDGPAAAAHRTAEARQLKGYLLVFEQLLADHLAQLDHLAPLLSFARLDATYFTQPLVHPAPAGQPGPPPEADPDDPPRIAPVLGADPELDRPGTAPKDGAWFARYQDGITRLAAEGDDVVERRERALDHLLARFNERFPETPPDRAAPARAARVEAKRRFLSDMVRLGADRGLGQNIRSAARPAVLDRVALKAGFDGDICLVEHLLLRDASGLDGIGDMEVGATFHIGEPRAVALRAGSLRVHAVLRGTPDAAPGVPLDTQIALLLARTDAARILPVGAYRPWLRFVGTGPLALEILERFSDHGTAEAVAAALRRGAETRLAGAPGAPADPAALSVRRIEMPLGFFASRISLFAELAGERTLDAERRSAVAAQVRAQLPAHLARDLYWLETADMQRLRRAFEHWRGLRAACAQAGDAPGAGLPEGLRRRAAVASRRLKDRIHASWCAAFLHRRAALPGPMRVG